MPKFENTFCLLDCQIGRREKRLAACLKCHQKISSLSVKGWQARRGFQKRFSNITDIFFVLSEREKSVRIESIALEEVVQGQVASDNGWQVILSRPGCSGGDEPGFEAIGDLQHKRRTLNTWLSSGTSARTFKFACSAGGALQEITEPKQVRKTKWAWARILYQINGDHPWSSFSFSNKQHYLPDQKNGQKIDSHVSPRISLNLLVRGSGQPLNHLTSSLCWRGFGV